jgi:uncharacterized protein
MLKVYPRALAACVLSLALQISPALGTPLADSLVKAAKSQVGVTLTYDPAYQSLAFPGGDVKPSTGVCTDVVIRALRKAKGLDLQLEINADMRANRSKYPTKRNGANARIDSNIDHRRVPNQMTYFERRGYALPITTDRSKYLPGDIAAWDLGRGLLHIGIVSDKKTFFGTPLVIHNISRGAVEEDILFKYPIIGHYRLPAKVVALRINSR